MKNFRRELDLRTGLFTVTYQLDGVTYRREAFCSNPGGLLAFRFSADKPGSLTGQLELTSRQKAIFAKSKKGIVFSGVKSNSFAVAVTMFVMVPSVRPVTTTVPLTEEFAGIVPT